MALASARKLWLAAGIELLYWVVLWLLGFALLPYGTSFYYLFFDIGVPIWVIAVFAVPEGMPLGSFIVAIMWALQLGASALEFGLRLTLITRPFVVGELLDIIFVILSFVQILLVLWCAVAALRNYMQEAGREAHDAALAAPSTTGADLETPGGPTYSTATVGDFAAGGAAGGKTSLTASAYSYNVHPRTPVRATE